MIRKRKISLWVRNVTGVLSDTVGDAGRQSESPHKDGENLQFILVYIQYKRSMQAPFFVDKLYET